MNYLIIFNGADSFWLIRLLYGEKDEKLLIIRIIRFLNISWMSMENLSKLYSMFLIKKWIHYYEIQRPPKIFYKECNV